jgi:thioredoxin-like negative regulator of GroEL
VAARSLLIALGLLALGCAVSRPPGAPAPRISDAALGGDEQFRASQQLVIEGLDADQNGDATRAESRYDRALQVDANNPWVYLALARHYVETGDPGRALSHLDRAETLLDAQQPPSPGAKTHLDGLRGAALALEGDQADAQPLLDSAARNAPDVWGDGELSAAELR